MTNKHNFSLTGVFAESYSGFVITDENKAQIRQFLRDKLNLTEQCDVSIASAWLDVNEIKPFSEWSVPNSDFDSTLVRSNVQSSIVRFGEKGIIFHKQLAIQITSEKSLPESVAVDIALLTSLTPNEDAMFLTFGDNEKANTLFNSDASELLQIRSSLQKSGVSANQTGVWKNDLVIMVYFTMNDFIVEYKENPMDAVEYYCNYIKRFRAAAVVYELMGVKYHIVKGAATWINGEIDATTEAIIPSWPAMKQDFFEEGLGSNVLEHKTTDSPKADVAVLDFEDAAAGALCIVVNVMSGENTQTKKVIYPVLSHSSDEALQHVETELQKQLIDFSKEDVKHVLLDDNNQHLLLGQTYKSLLDKSA